jgi:ubiquinone/menaquinone biosynthesis C-methylase UbiE
MGCHGGFALDEATRRSWYNPEAILQDLHTDNVFADIGCGDGFFSILAAKKVGEKGKVYAVDIDASAIEKLKHKAQTNDIHNITSIVGAAENAIFCVKCADFVFFSMVLHDFDDPTRVLKNSKQMLKLSGRLIDLDWKKQEMPFGPPVRIRFSEEKATDLIEDAGLRVVSVKDAGSYHYIVTAMVYLSTIRIAQQQRKTPASLA